LHYAHFSTICPIASPKNAQNKQTNKKQPPESTKSKKQIKTKWVLVKAKRSTLGKKVFFKPRRVKKKIVGKKTNMMR